MSDLYRSRAPRSSSRRQQQTALPAEITTPVAQAFSSEYQAAAEVNKQAEEQDLIKQQQEAEQERQQIQRQSVATAKKVGQQTQTDPLTGAESVKKDTATGKPIWEAGFVGDPTPDNEGKPVVPYRFPDGRTAQVPLERINRKTEKTGENFLEFDYQDETGNVQRIRRPEDKSNPLFKIDEATGQRYRDVADATGSMVRQPLGIDPVAANQARINKRKEAYAKEKEALKFQEDTLQLEMQGEELNLKPLKEKLTEAEKLAKQYAPEAAKDKSRYELRPDGYYRVDGAFGDLPAIPRKVETPDEIAAANNWLKQKEQADKQFQGIKAEHDPVELRVRDLEKRRNALAKQALAASKRAQTDMADMEIAALAGLDLSRPQWKQVLDIAKKDEHFQKIMAAGEAEDQGSQLADAMAGAINKHNKNVEMQSVIDDAERAFDYLNAKAPKTMAEESAAAQVEAEQAVKTSLVDMLASGVRGDKGTVDATDQAKATEIATKSLGVQDPENWSLSPDNRGNYNLHHTSDEAPLGWLDPKNKRVMLFPSATVTDAGQQLLEKASADGFPVYHLGSEATGGGVPMTHQELRDYVAKGVEIARSAATPDEKEALLAKEGITPTDIREQVMSGRMSVQDGRWLNEKLFEEKELDNSPDGYAKGFAEYLAANKTQANIMANGTPEQKIAVANNYSDARAGQSAGNMFYQRDTMADRRVELAQKVAPPPGPIEKKIDQAFALPGKIILPMIGLLGQMPAWAGQEALKRAGYETEAGRLADEQFGDYQKRIKGYTNKVLTRDDVVESVSEIRQWANRARPGDQPPDELAAKIAKSVFDGYHQLTDESARNLNTSLDTFNVNKDPLLKAMLQRYLTTSDPSAFDQMTAMMVMDTKDRKTTGEVMKYIENPRVASPELVADRATELGLTIQPGTAPRLLELAGALDKAKDEKQYQSIIAQAGKMLGTTTESDTHHVLQAITAQVTDDPDSWWGMLKGGFVAGRQEAFIELGSTLAEIGVSALTGFTATPEVIAAKVARRTALSAARAAFKRTAVASLDALGDQFKSFAVARNAISKGRLKLGAALRTKADEFAKAGIITEKFGVPLTAGQKLKNAAVTVGKTAAVSTPIEGGEELVGSFGDVDPTIQGSIEQMGMGAIGAGLITPIFLGAATVRNAYQSRKAENMLGQAKAKWVEKFNERNAKTPGFKPITVAQYEAWSGVADNPAQKEAELEYQADLAEKLAAYKEAESAPVAGPAKAAPPAPATTPETKPDATSQKGQGQGQEVLTSAPEATPVAEAQPAPATTPARNPAFANLSDGELSERIATAERLSTEAGRTDQASWNYDAGLMRKEQAARASSQAQTEEEPVLAPDPEDTSNIDQPFAAPAARPLTPRQIAADARLEASIQKLAGLSQIAYSAAEEIFAIPEADRPLYTAVAKAKAGSTIYTADEAKALIKQNGANAVAFQKAEILPPDVQGPRNLKTLADLPKAIQVGPNLYRLPEGVQIAVPDALTASVVSNAPSLGILLQTSAQAQAAAKPVVSPEYLKQWEQFGTVKTEGGSIAVTSDTRKAHEAAMFALKQAGIKPSKVVSGPNAAGKTEHTILFEAPDSAKSKAAPKPKAFTPAPAKDIVQQVAKANPKIVALLRPTPNANTTRENGGMWIGKDEKSIEIHFETLDSQLATLQAQGRITSAEQAAEHVQGVLDEEIRHIANIEASRRLHKKVAPDQDYHDWRTAYYGKMWKDEFTEDQRKAVMDAYGDTLKGASDYIKALEGLRMVSQVGSKWGKITEAVLFHLEQVLAVLREMIAKPSAAIKAEIDAIKAILDEYGYDTAETPKSSTQFTLNKADAKPVIDFAKSIPDAELSTEVPGAAADEAREDEPHITVLYGLTEHEAGPVQQAIADHGPVTVKLGKLSIFENDKYDVLKVEVTGDSLHKLNAKLSKLPNANTYPDYKPHMTIAYLKKGEGKKYVGDTRFAGKELTFDTMTFSPPKELRGELGKPELPLTSQEITITVKKGGENEIRTLAFSDPQDAAVFDIADKYDSLNRQQKPEERKKLVAEINAFADALAAKLTADGTATTRQKLLGTDKNGGRGTIRAYADRVRTQAIEGNTLDPFTPQTFDSYTKHGNVAAKATEQKKQAVRGTRWTDNTRTSQRSDDGQRLISKIKRVSKGIGEPTTSAEWTWFRSLAQDAARMQQDTPRSVAEIRAMAEKNETEDPRAAVWWILDNLMQWPNGRPQNQFDAPADYTNAIAGDFVDAEDGAPSRLDELSSLLRDQEQTDIPAADLGAAILEDMSAANAPGQQNINDQAETEGEEVAAAEDEAAAEEAAATGRSKADVMADPLIQPKIREKAAAKIKKARQPDDQPNTPPPEPEIEDLSDDQPLSDLIDENPKPAPQQGSGVDDWNALPKLKPGKHSLPNGADLDSLPAFSMSGNKAALLRNYLLPILTRLAKGATRFVDLFGGTGMYTHALAEAGVLPKGSILNEWEWHRALTHKWTQQDHQAVAEHMAEYRARMTDALNQHTSVDDKRNAWEALAIEFLNEQVDPDMARQQSEWDNYRRVPLKDEPKSAAMYLIVQGLAFGNRTLEINREGVIEAGDLVSAPSLGRAIWTEGTGADGKPKSASKGFIAGFITPEGYKIPLRVQAPLNYLRPASRRLQDVEIRGPWDDTHGDAIQILNRPDLVKDGDLVSYDPPYLPNIVTDESLNYGEGTGIFGSLSGAIRLIGDAVQPASDRGAMVVSTNNFQPALSARLSSLGWENVGAYRAGTTDLQDSELISFSHPILAPDADTMQLGGKHDWAQDAAGNRDRPARDNASRTERLAAGTKGQAAADVEGREGQPAAAGQPAVRPAGESAERGGSVGGIEDNPFSSPAALRAEILESQKGYISPKLKGTKAWLTPDGRWINVDQHYEIAPPDFWETNKGFDRDLTTEVKAAGFARVVYDRRTGELMAEYDALTPAQRSELKNTATELFAELVYDRGGLFSAPARAYESMQFDPPFATSFGDIMSYEWMSKPVGGMTSQQVSDWNQARTNPVTGRPIVHHFKVKGPDGMATVSLETAMGRLSPPDRSKLSGMIRSEQRRREEAAAGQMTLFSAPARLGVNERTQLGESWKTVTERDSVDGRDIINADNIPNTSSIGSSLDEYKILKGLREVPMDVFPGLSGRHYSVQGSNRIDQLAGQIADSKEITPLIVVIDSEGPYILEGATRGEAMFKLKAKSFPALVVIDEYTPKDITRESAAQTGTLMPDGAVLSDGPGMVQMPLFAAPVRAFHGTPHKVDKFSLDKIGTGEGVQAYGWGLYFAQDENIAAHYADKLSTSARYLYDGVEVPPYDEITPENMLTRDPRELLGAAVKWGAGFQFTQSSDERAESMIRWARSHNGRKPLPLEVEDRLDEIGRSFDPGKLTSAKGNLYTVDLLGDQDDFLDYDLPFTGQSEKIREKLMKSPFGTEYADSPNFRDLKNGAQIYDWFSTQELPEIQTAEGNFYPDYSNRAKNASKQLLDLGIKGIRYLDGNARNLHYDLIAAKRGVKTWKHEVEVTQNQGAKDQLKYAENHLAEVQRKYDARTSNFVIFDDKLVRILEENGKPAEQSGLIASAPASRPSMPQAEAQAIVRNLDKVQATNEPRTIPDIAGWSELQDALSQARATIADKDASKKQQAALVAQYHTDHPDSQAAIDQRKAESARIGRPIPPAWTNVQLYPDGSRLLVKGRDAKGRLQSIYSRENTEAGLAEKFERQKRVNAAMPRLVAGIDEGLAKGLEEASVLRLIYLSGFRNGGEKDTGAKMQAYGATTLLSDHVSIEGDTVTFDFTGKLGVRQQHVIVHAGLAADLARRKAAAPAGGRLFKTSPQRVLGYLRHVTGADDIKVHDLRTWNATSLAAELIKANEAPTTETDFWLKRDAVADVVARKLGDTRKIVLEAYIDPIVFEKWRESATVSDDSDRPKISRKDAAARGTAGQLQRPFEDYERSLRDELLPPSSEGSAAESGAGRLSQPSLFSRPSMPQAEAQAIVRNLDKVQAVRPLNAQESAAYEQAKASLETSPPTQSTQQQQINELHDDLRKANAGRSNSPVQEEWIDSEKEPISSQPQPRTAQESQTGRRIAGNDRFGGADKNDASLMSAPAADPKAEALRTALDTMPPIWRDVLESSMAGEDADTIAARLNLPPVAVANIQRVAEARLRILLDAAAGRLKPSVQPVQDNWYDPPTLKATSGRPDLALSGIPAVTAVDQRRAGPETVTRAEMNDMARRMFAADRPATERLLTAWMQSGGMAIDTASAPESLQNIIREANARQAGHMLMTAAAQQMVIRNAIAGTNALETANMIDLYRNTGTEQARALAMRQDPNQKPAERAAQFIQEVLLTPPTHIQNEMAKNPANRASVLARWVARAEKIKAELVAEGYDIDATFRQFHVEQQLADAVVPESIGPVLDQADPKTQRIVRSILEGESWAEAARSAETPIATAREAYNAFRQGVRDAYQAFKKEFLGAAPLEDQVSLLGLPEWTLEANPDAVPVQTEATARLKQHRARRKVGGEFDLNNPLAASRVERAVEMRKATGFDKLSEFWRASILTGPQTHIVNIVSGMTYGAYEATVKKIGAGALADMARMFGMKPDAASLSDLPAMLSATLPAVRQAFIDAMRSFQFESRMFDAYAEGQSPTSKNSNLFKEQYQPALKGTLGTLMRGASFRLMGAADEFVKSFFTRIEVAAQARQVARAEGHKGLALANAISEQMKPGSLAWLRALEHSKKITFQTKLGSTDATIDKLDQLAKIINTTKQGQYGGLPKGIAHFVFPFVDTPANIFKQAVTISPLGGLLAIMDATQALRRLKQGNKEQAAKLYNASRALSDITNQIVAWGAVLAIAELAKPGDDDDQLPFITGTMPWRETSKGEREIAYRTAPPQSIRIGDKWISYRRLDPFATALAFMVDSIRDFQSGKPADEILPKIGVNMMHNMQDKTFLQGISDLMNAIQDPSRFGTKWATNIATGFMPNLVRQPIRSADEMFRENDLPNSMSFWDVLGHRVGFGMYPVGWDNGVLPKNPLAPLPATDVWGRPANKNTGTGGPNTDMLLRLFSPVDTRDTANVDPLDVRLLRWNMANPDDTFAMTAPTREIKRTINGKPVSVSLSDAEHADLTARSGQAARQAIGNRYNDRDLTKEDVKQIRQITDKAHDQFRELAFRRNYKPTP